MKYISEIITGLNLFFIFMTPLLIILIKAKINKKGAFVVPVIISMIISGFYLFEMKKTNEEKNHKEDFINKIKIKGKDYLKDVHTESGHNLYVEKFERANVGEKDINEYFLIGIDWLNDRSLFMKFLNLYSKLMIKSPHTCHQFVQKKIFFNDIFFKNVFRLKDEEQIELIQIVTESIFFYFVRQRTELKDQNDLHNRENNVNKEIIKTGKKFEQELLENSRILNISESSSVLLSNEKINEKCRSKIIKFTNISGEDMYTQDKYLNEIKLEIWKALSQEKSKL